jgi:SAM-dependent methyltransferase
MQDRKQREKYFHNKVFNEHTRVGLSRFYRLGGARGTFYKNLVKNNCRGKRILEYGCGPGGYSFSLAKSGAKVVGIDISEVAVKQARDTARMENVEGSIEFLVMDAENLMFKDNYFDIVCGTGVLHHLDVGRAFSEISRVLKPGGKAIFLEPLGYNPLINIFRRLTPKLRTKDEHPLKSNDSKIASHYFNSVNLYHFDLSTLLVLPFTDTSFFDWLLSGFRYLDRILFKLPLVRWLSWAVVIELSGPKKFPQGLI